MSKSLFFIALLPPTAIQQEVNLIKHYFSEVYNSKAALKSPPHITLQPPFYWEQDRLLELKTVLQEFAQKQASISIILRKFAAFPPRVIYIDVINSQELLLLQQELNYLLESALNIVDRAGRKRSFTPHMTVGFKDLTKANFYQAWSEFQVKSFNYQFTASKLTLLQHNGQSWSFNAEFTLLKQ